MAQIGFQNTFGVQNDIKQPHFTNYVTPDSFNDDHGDISRGDVMRGSHSFVQHTDNMLEPAWDYVYLCVSLLWLFVGVPGNLLVILSVLCFKELRLLYF